MYFAILVLAEGPRIGECHEANSLEEAIEKGIEIAGRQEEELDKDAAKEELEETLSYGGGLGEWSVCVGQSE